MTNFKTIRVRGDVYDYIKQQAGVSGLTISDMLRVLIGLPDAQNDVPALRKINERLRKIERKLFINN